MEGVDDNALNNDTIYRSVKRGAGWDGAAISLVASPDAHSGLPNGTTYYYTVMPNDIRGWGHGWLSAEVHATPAP